MNKTVCIAGKNDIAVNGLHFVREHFPDCELLGVANRGDSGVDGWQRSFKKACLDLSVKEVSLEAVYEISDLIFVSLEFDRIVDTKQFSTDRLFNIHFSLLPSYKGMFTSCLPLLHGERSSGVTLHEIDDGIDTGPIIAQHEFSLDTINNARGLYFKYLDEGLVLFREYFHSLYDCSYISVPQDACLSTYFSKTAIDFNNVVINFRATAFQVVNAIRAFSFKEYQVPRCFDRDIEFACVTSSRSVGVPGAIIRSTATSIVVATIDYDVELFNLV